jgi:hypothetical protein
VPPHEAARAQRVAPLCLNFFEDSQAAQTIPDGPASKNPL